MIGFAFSAIVIAMIDCNELIKSNDQSIEWQHNICIELSKSYQNVSLTLLSNSVATDNGIRENPDESISVFPIQGGRVKVSVNEKELGTGKRSYLFGIEAFKEVWVLSRRLKSGSIIRSRDLIKKSVNIAPYIGVKEFFSDPPIGKRMISTQKRNSIVFVDSVEDPNLISVGDELVAVIVDGRVTIEATAIALESSKAVNEKIQVRLVATGATFVATITGNKHVQIDL